MSNPEIGECSAKQYEKGKTYLVTPERLCVQGVYIFACRAKPGLGWEACMFGARVDGVRSVSSEDMSFLVSISFEDAAQTSTFGESKAYETNSAGIIELKEGMAQEAYLRHRFEEVDFEKESIENIITVPPRVATVPTVTPLILI